MQSASDEVLRDLAPAGELRAAINFGNPVLAQRASETDEPIGISVDLARELGRCLEVPVTLVTFEAAGKVVDAARSNVWDVAFLAIDPKRKEEMLFTEPYLVIEATYLVHLDSSFRSLADIDTPGVRIAVGRGAAYDLFLSRTLKHAQLVRSETSSGALDLFHASKLEAAAGVVQPLLDYAKQHPGFRVIDGRFAAIEQAVGTPADKLKGIQYLQSFIAEMKASGFIAALLERSGQIDPCVAPSKTADARAKIL
jgi:polar amino acid transport system substrate-binding protein